MCYVFPLMNVLCFFLLPTYTLIRYKFNAWELLFVLVKMYFSHWTSRCQMKSMMSFKFAVFYQSICLNFHLSQWFFTCWRLQSIDCNRFSYKTHLTFPVYGALLFWICNYAHHIMILFLVIFYLEIFLGSHMEFKF